MSYDVMTYVVDDDETTRKSLRLMLKTVGLETSTYALPSEFLANFNSDRPGCVILDLRMPEMNGVETLIRLRERGRTVPVIFLSAYGCLSAVVRAMKLGAVDFFEKPIEGEVLLESIQHWVEYEIKAHEAMRERQATLARLAQLSSRERQVLDCVLDGLSNKETARCLGVSPKAIESYRAHLMQKMEVRNVVKLVIRVVSCLKFASHSDQRLS